jgi:hypothetical protein
MAHFAKLNENNVVLEVQVVHNNELLQDGVESESKGAQFLVDLFGENANWKQTSYTGRICKNYAGIGYTYDAQRNAFIPPQPFPSWTLNEDTCLWDCPIPMPTDGQFYHWDEANTSWILSET